MEDLNVHHMRRKRENPDMADIQYSDRFALWVIPEFPIDLPWVRDRTPQPGEEWRYGLLEDIRKNGMKNHIAVYGHTPCGAISPKYKTSWNADRDERYQVRVGTNRLWCLLELGHKTFPAVLSLNHGMAPEHRGLEGHMIKNEDISKYMTDGQCWVSNHGFGLIQAVPPEKEYSAFRQKI